MNKQAAIYARVSTDDQAERGYSLPSQVEACQKFASQKGFDVVGVYQDDISGAKPIVARPEGGELQQAINLRQINSVIVYQVDRLSRDIVDLLTTVRDWLRAGVEVYALDIGQVTSELDIVLVIKGWQGGDERQKIRERTMRGKNAKAKSGRVVGNGFAPYGYTYADGEFLIKESEARIVRMIFDWYVNGDEHGRMMSLISIAQRLTEMGIPTPSESKGWTSKRARYGSWVFATVYYLLTCETYYGVMHYGKEKGHHGGKRPKDEQIIVPVPALVTRETWDLAQARRAYNARASKRKMTRAYLLRGLIFCGCGRRMAGTNGNYICTRYYNPNGSGEPCREPVVKGEIIEPVTWDYLMKLIKDPQQFEEKLRQAQAREAAAMRPKQKELAHVIALLEDTEKEAEELAQTIKQVKGIVGEALKQQAGEVDRRYQALRKRKKELQESLELELTDRNIKDFLRFRATVAVGMGDPTPEDKRRCLEMLQTAVTGSG